MKFLRILTPSSLELTLILPFTVIVLAFALFSKFIVSDYALLPEQGLSAENNIVSNIDYAFDYLNNQPFTAYLANVTFWILIGSAVYIIMWFIINILVDLSRNLKISHSFVHPRSFHQSDIWLAYILKLIFRLASFVLLVFGGFYWLTTFMPSVVYVCRFYVMADSPILAKALTLIICFILMSASLHVLAILLRMFFIRSQSLSY